MDNPSPLTTERIFHAYLQVARHADNPKDISLAKIAEVLGVSRQAIYKNHFQNINELTQSLHYYVDNKPFQAMKRFVKHQESYDLPELLNFFAEEIIPNLYEKHDFLGVFYSHVADPAWRPYLNKQYVDLLMPYYEGADGNVHGLTSKTLAELTINSVMAAISVWLTEDEPVPPEVFSERFLFLFTHSLVDLAKKE
ncbi:TetR/AcrR family transcriptional regulator [Fructobacillus ficulneus]|uniref:Transcriptional regulator n=1 Tax=Fructobacillus ficulneus TaxID=157463 RepID=A0A0K8MH19_9LACO|nr:TetR/AcrR family transcriptional regulator [Fructobacillus ficulneus]GAO99179.1 hypothetical protein FFIC_090010 [Fructobacillus ficulneus]